MVNKSERILRGENFNSMKIKQRPYREKKEKGSSGRRGLSGVQKAEICRLKERGVSQVTLAKQFDISEATVSKIVRDKVRWLSLDPNTNKAIMKRQRTGKHPLLEEAVALWISRAVAASLTITGEIIRGKAKKLAKALDIKDFNASKGWLTNFKKRYHIKEYKRQGEGASAPLEKIPQFQSELREIIKSYQPEDVYNADETGLYWRMVRFLGKKSLKTELRSYLHAMPPAMTSLLLY